MGKEKILIVEDEEAIQELIRYNLNKEGFDRVRCCDSGEKALETALDFAPDLILLDDAARNRWACRLPETSERAAHQYGADYHADREIRGKRHCRRFGDGGG